MKNVRGERPSRSPAWQSRALADGPPSSNVEGNPVLIDDAG